MSDEQICFICRNRIEKGESSKRFERSNRSITIHRECIHLLVDVIRSGLQKEISTQQIEVQTLHNRILELVQRDADGLFIVASESVYKLAAREAVALVLYIEGKPLTIEELSIRMKRCYKEIPKGSLRTYLTARDLKTSIRLKVARTEQGYQLNKSGIQWFEKNVAPKILGENNNQSK